MEAPARGTRPRNRRALTLTAASDLFSSRGYARVSMGDIAAATNVGASAIYRHFPHKSALLLAAIRTGLEPFTRILEAPEDRTATTETDPAARLDAVTRELAACALDHRTLGVLWQREARNLDPAEQRLLREELRATTGALAARVRDARPDLTPEDADLLAWCAMGVLVSVGFHSLDLERAAYEALLVTLVRAVTGVALPDTIDEAGPHPAPPEPPSRRDELITEATALFARKGFPAVGIDDIGEAVGIAGPSIYTHFPSKQAILVAAIDRANTELQHRSAQILDGGDDARTTLGGLAGTYVDIADGDRATIRIVLSELDQLEPDDRDTARRAQRRYIDTWVRLLREIDPVDATTARIRVQAVLLTVSDAVQTPHLRELPGFRDRLGAIARAVLGL